MGPEMITDDALMAYLDGEADPDRARQIEAELASNAALRVRLDAMAARDRAVRGAFDALLDRPAPDAMAARIRAIAAGDNVVSLGARQAVRPRRAWVAAALAAQAALLAGAVVVLSPARETGASDAEYKALSSAARSDAPNVMIMFAPNATEAQLRDTLAGVEGRVVGGPNAAGAWLVRVPAASRDRILPQLRQRPEVSLAEPVDAP
ncbi:MAG: hypothetical protein JNK30_09985 [Phenylobacterium sp.]|uniref:anti-sigma factor family protein n=1 Tax=Phenylobacterium sp. TaxID=1871053 RepID=UPI001A3CCEB2|nr:hypothetical protein [Phenylobacterium sp.]MBL8771698.1 hypothetical protein [Phenylobacterium sp.]